MAYIALSQKRSLIGVPKKLRVVVQSLGFRRIGQTRYYRDSRALRGQINKARHLLSYVLLTELPQEATCGTRATAAGASSSSSPVSPSSDFAHKHRSESSAAQDDPETSTSL